MVLLPHNTHYLAPRNLHVFPLLPVSSKVGLSDCITEQRTQNINDYDSGELKIPTEMFQGIPQINRNPSWCLSVSIDAINIK